MRGPALAPQVIRRALRCDSSNMWSENGTDLGADGSFTDIGDLAIEPMPADEAFSAITERVATLVEQGFHPLLLGGDHSITFPVVRGIAQHHPALNLLHFDAHPDLYEEFEGNRFSHACPFARIMEARLVKRLVQVGIRTMNAHQRQQAERFGVEVIEMQALRDDLALRFDGPLYITFDMDALDPAFAPGVSHHEPGGLSTRQAISLIQRVQAPQVVGADIVEFNPRRDTPQTEIARLVATNMPPLEPIGITAMAAAKILKELAARMLT